MTTRHYALTLRAWVQNLEGSWDDAVLEAGERRGAGADLAALHGGLGSHLRGREDLDPPGAGGEWRRRRERLPLRPRF